MKKPLLFSIFVGILFFYPTQSKALTIGFEPTNQFVFIGDSVNIDLTVSGLGEFVPFWFFNMK